MLDELTAAPADELELEAEQSVTALELFFDLVFVFAITQVTGFLYHDPTWTRLVEALAILAALWWAWSGYAWLGNTAGTDEGLFRVVLLGVMGPLLVASLAVPGAFGEHALLFGVAFFVVRVLHIGAYWALGKDDPQLGYVVLRLARTIFPAAGLLVVAGAVPGTTRAVCWAGALAIDYGGLWLGGTEGWRVNAAHFAERHRLIVIIALGESIVALGVGTAELGAGVVVTALLGIAVVAALWWVYFDVVATVAARKLREADQDMRARMARDSFTYIHLPIVAGIVIFAFGVKVTLAHVHAELASLPAVALTCGVGLYLVALSALKRRNIGSWNYPRLVATAALACLVPVAMHIAALASLALVAAVACGLVAYETWRYAEARDRIRHG
ncbi:MAG TPA: low temperature requirement protein A [Gaiellaceae bacterium]|jgi:low temperature requirement protein LtrA